MTQPGLGPELNTSYLGLQELTTADIHGLLDESLRSFLPSRDHPNETAHDLIAQMQSDPSFQIFGYVVQSTPVSYIVALSHKDPGTVSIGPMFVSAKARGMKLGRRQVEDFIAWADTSGYASVYTKTWGNNQASRHIFTELGFAEYKTKPNDRADGDSTISYLLDLGR